MNAHFTFAIWHDFLSRLLLDQEDVRFSAGIARTAQARLCVGTETGRATTPTALTPCGFAAITLPTKSGESCLPGRPQGHGARASNARGRSLRDQRGGMRIPAIASDLVTPPHPDHVPRIASPRDQNGHPPWACEHPKTRVTLND